MSDDTYRGSTWYPLESATCPQCGGDVFSNGDMETCQDCDWNGDIVEGGR